MLAGELLIIYVTIGGFRGQQIAFFSSEQLTVWRVLQGAPIFIQKRKLFSEYAPQAPNIDGLVIVLLKEQYLWRPVSSRYDVGRQLTFFSFDVTTRFGFPPSIKHFLPIFPILLWQLTLQTALRMTATAATLILLAQICGGVSTILVEMPALPRHLLHQTWSCESKITQFGDASRINENIVRFNVTVHQAGAVDEI